jgi:phage gpG-like protein
MSSKLSEDLEKLQRDLKKAISSEIPRRAGKAGVDYFRESFVTESFDGVKWPAVKRRDPGSKWYGFQYKGKGSPRFSAAATRRRVLTGSTGELGDSINYIVRPFATIFRSDKPYAKVHNEGLMAKVFGKHPFKMKKRQFMGPAKQLDKKVDKIVDDAIDRAFTR